MPITITNRNYPNHYTAVDTEEEARLAGIVADIAVEGLYIAMDTTAVALSTAALDKIAQRIEAVAAQKALQALRLDDDAPY